MIAQDARRSLLMVSSAEPAIDILPALKDWDSYRTQPAGSG